MVIYKVSSVRDKSKVFQKDYYCFISDTAKYLLELKKKFNFMYLMTEKILYLTFTNS